MVIEAGFTSYVSRNITVQWHQMVFLPGDASKHFPCAQSGSLMAPFFRTLALLLTTFSFYTVALDSHGALSFGQTLNLTAASRCVDYWTAPQCNFKHCTAALQQLWMREKLRRSIEHEFCGRRQQPRTFLETIVAPQIFKAGRLGSPISKFKDY